MVMRLFPCLHYRQLRDEDYMDLDRLVRSPTSPPPAPSPLGSVLGGRRKAHTAPLPAAGKAACDGGGVGAPAKREVARRRQSCDEQRYTPCFPKTGRPAADPKVATPSSSSSSRRPCGGGGCGAGGGGGGRTAGFSWQQQQKSRGWLHSDEQLAEGGVCFAVRYVGCVEVKTSMKSLDFDTRTRVARESIRRVCQSAGLLRSSPSRKRKQLDKRITKMLAERPNMIHAGSNINFTISTDNLGLVIMESGEIIATHQMQGISFASGGDLDTQDFVAYVAKDGAGRACYVMECTGGLAQDVITTIGQAFELRFKEYLRKTTKTVKLHRAELRGQHGRPARTGVGAGRVSDDAHSQSPPPLPARTHRIHRQALCRRLIEANQVSDLTNENNGLAATDMIDSLGDQEQVMPPPPPIRSDSHRIHTRVPLDSEAWFHRNVTRSEAERLIREDGDFLVRESSQSDGQYVLTGMQRGTVKHLLLVDNDGVVRTRDRVFESVVHLIDYHRQNQLPIMSTDSATSLVNPVLCQQCQPDPR